MKILRIILLLFIISSCSHKAMNGERNISSGNGELKFNLSLIHTLSSRPTSDDVHPTNLPYYMKYKRGNIELVYLASPHTSDVNSKSHKAIDTILKVFQPDSLVLELPPNRDNLRDSVINRCNTKKKCSEGIYAYKKATDLGLKVIVGEPQHKEVFNKSLKHGLTENEVLFFYTFRGVASWRQGDPKRAYTPKNPVREIKRYIRGNKKRLGLNKSKFNYNDFISIYEQKMSKAFNYKKVRYNDIAPYKDGHFIQQLSVIVDKTREESILIKTERAITENLKVFIVYGSGHFLKHRPVFKDFFESEELISLR